MRSLRLHKESPSQTAGPYVHIGLMPILQGITGPNRNDLGTGPLSVGSGERILVSGRVLDGSGTPVSDAIVEVWQADSDGEFRNGWGRSACDGIGRFEFDTVKPGQVADSYGKWMAPHLTIWIVARGINIGLHTRVYFEDEVEANSTDPVLNGITDAMRRKTLMAARSLANGRTVYVLDIRLQGDEETVFFDI